MAYTDIDKPTDYFNTVTYSGTGSTQSITGVGFQPDWVWGKGRTLAGYNHGLVDSVRGTGKNIYSNLTDAEETYSTGITSFGSDGFSVGSGNVFNNGSNTYVAWNWLASNSTASNTDGDITSTVSANTTSGFSIVKYTGNGSASNIGHGLGSALKCIIIKKTSATADWLVGHNSLHPTLPWKYGINLSNTGARHESGTYFADTAPTASVFRVEENNEVNANGATYIAYCFAEKKGFSKAFSYTGNGSTDGSFTYLGFRPAWVMIKRTDSSASWTILDNKRDSFNVTEKRLFPDSNDPDTVGANGNTDFLSNGIKMRTSHLGINVSGGSYIGIAFAESPFVTSTGIPTTAR